MSDIEQRIKQAVAEQLGLKAEEIKNEALSIEEVSSNDYNSSYL